MTNPTSVRRRRTPLLLGAGLVLAASLLAACGGDDSGSASSDTTAAGGSGGGSDSALACAPAEPGTDSGKLFFENWPAYIDSETVDAFKADTGIDLTYTEAFSDNNEYFAKVQPQLSRGQAVEPDIIAPTNWMAGRFTQLGWNQQLPVDQIPNIKNLRPDLQKPATDPTGLCSLPWQTGITGIAYNIKATGRELTSVEDLFDPALKGKIGMLTEMRDTIGLLLLSQGIDPSTVTTYEEAKPAFDKLEELTNSGQIRAFTGNDYLDDLSQGNFAAAVAWSGDVLQLTKDNPDVRFIIPKEGGMSWFDTMIWLKGSGATAEDVAAWMNYVYDPVNAARITAEVQYVSPVVGVQDELRKMGGDAAALADDPLLFPDAATLAKLKVFAALSEEEEAKFDARFAEITGA